MTQNITKTQNHSSAIAVLHLSDDFDEEKKPSHHCKVFVFVGSIENLKNAKAI